MNVLRVQRCYQANIFAESLAYNEVICRRMMGLLSEACLNFVTFFNK